MRLTWGRTMVLLCAVTIGLAAYDIYSANLLMVLQWTLYSVFGIK